ncbi:MAG: NAD(P)H-hydrate dehydratase [Ruminococcus sp.]|nr:NAD(P)H-hydrate dehydratase [Ruminococcus sp.]
MSRDRIVTREQMRACERESERLGVSLAELMDNAGEGLGRELLHLLIEKNEKSAVILCGKGNNGGDGLVAARFLAQSGIAVTVMLCCGAPDTPLSAAAYEKLPAEVRVIDGFDGGRAHCELLLHAPVIADCIFGTGFRGEIDEELSSLLSAAAATEGTVVACDIPSGVDAQNGKVSRSTLPADITVTFHAAKLGMTLSPARYFCGEVKVCPIGIPDEVYASAELADTVIDLTGEEVLMRHLLPKRKPWGSKWDFGRLVCVCGSERYIGAAGICTEAALRSGAGLVHLCAPAKVVSSLAAQLYETVYTPMRTDTEGFMTSDDLTAILKKLERADALLIGCGLGHTPRTERLVTGLVENSPVPVILDADGINSLAPNIDVLLKKKSEVILTPHPGELATLCGKTSEEVLEDRYSCGRELAEKYGVTVVSKNAETIVFIPGEGTVTAAVLRTGNTALAKGGSGDMLAGLIASLTAQSPDSIPDGALLGCYVMGKTAELLSEERSERGILARDVIRAIPAYLKALENVQDV